MRELIERAKCRELLRSGRARQEIRQNAEVSENAILAEELGVHETTVYRWENGKREPRGAMATGYGRLLEKLRQNFPGEQS